MDRIKITRSFGSSCSQMRQDRLRLCIAVHDAVPTECIDHLLYLQPLDLMQIPEARLPSDRVTHEEINPEMQTTEKDLSRVRSDDGALTLRQTLQTQHYALKPENEPLKPCARRPVLRPRDKKRVPKKKFVSREMPNSSL